MRALCLLSGLLLSACGSIGPFEGQACFNENAMACSAMDNTVLMYCYHLPYACGMEWRVQPGVSYCGNFCKWEEDGGAICK